MLPHIVLDTVKTRELENVDVKADEWLFHNEEGLIEQRSSIVIYKTGTVANVFTEGITVSKSAYRELCALCGVTETAISSYLFAEFTNKPVDIGIYNGTTICSILPPNSRVKPFVPIQIFQEIQQIPLLKIVEVKGSCRCLSVTVSIGLTEVFDTSDEFAEISLVVLCRSDGKRAMFPKIKTMNASFMLSAIRWDANITTLENIKFGFSEAANLIWKLRRNWMRLYTKEDLCAFIKKVLGVSDTTRFVVNYFKYEVGFVHCLTAFSILENVGKAVNGHCDADNVTGTLSKQLLKSNGQSSKGRKNEIAIRSGISRNIDGTGYGVGVSERNR